MAASLNNYLQRNGALALKEGGNHQFEKLDEIVSQLHLIRDDISVSLSRDTVGSICNSGNMSGMGLSEHIEREGTRDDGDFFQSGHSRTSRPETTYNNALLQSTDEQNGRFGNTTSRVRKLLDISQELRRLSAAFLSGKDCTDTSLSGKSATTEITSPSFASWDNPTGSNPRIDRSVLKDGNCSSIVKETLQLQQETPTEAEEVSSLENGSSHAGSDLDIEQEQVEEIMTIQNTKESNDGASSTEIPQKALLLPTEFEKQHGSSIASVDSIAACSGSLTPGKKQVAVEIWTGTSSGDDGKNECKKMDPPEHAELIYDNDITSIDEDSIDQNEGEEHRVSHPVPEHSELIHANHISMIDNNLSVLNKEEEHRVLQSTSVQNSTISGAIYLGGETSDENPEMKIQDSMARDETKETIDDGKVSSRKIPQDPPVEQRTFARPTIPKARSLSEYNFKRTLLDIVPKRRLEQSNEKQRKLDLRVASQHVAHQRQNSEPSMDSFSSPRTSEESVSPNQIDRRLHDNEAGVESEAQLDQLNDSRSKYKTYAEEDASSQSEINHAEVPKDTLAEIGRRLNSPPLDHGPSKPSNDEKATACSLTGYHVVTMPSVGSDDLSSLSTNSTRYSDYSKEIQELLQESGGNLRCGSDREGVSRTKSFSENSLAMVEEFQQDLLNALDKSKHDRSDTMETRKREQQYHPTPESPDSGAHNDYPERLYSLTQDIRKKEIDRMLEERVESKRNRNALKVERPLELAYSKSTDEMYVEVCAVKDSKRKKEFDVSKYRSRRQAINAANRMRLKSDSTPTRRIGQRELDHVDRRRVLENAKNEVVATEKRVSGGESRRGRRPSTERKYPPNRRRSLSRQRGSEAPTGRSSSIEPTASRKFSNFFRF